MTFGAELDDDVLNAPSAEVEIEVHQKWDGKQGAYILWLIGCT